MRRRRRPPPIQFNRVSGCIINEIIDRKQCKHKLPNRFAINGQTVRNKTNIAKAFNEYFASIGTEMADFLPTVDGYETYLKTTPAIFF